MGFLKRKTKILLPVFYGVYLVLHLIVVRYQKTQTAQLEMMNGNASAWNQINQLEKLWLQAKVDNLVSYENMACSSQLEQARVRLKKVEKEIEESENRVQGVGKGDQEFFCKAHAYYRHAASALIDIIDFLLTNREKYSVNNKEIEFESESHVARFRELIERISNLQREKEDLDTFILAHNRELLVR